MKRETFICDGCGGDLTANTKRLELADTLPEAGLYPAIDRPHHFCDIACLDHWNGRELLYGNLRKERAREWAEEHGTKDDSGNVRFYPCPPQAALDTWKTECRAATLAAFPLQIAAVKQKLAS